MDGLRSWVQTHAFALVIGLAAGAVGFAATGPLSRPAPAPIEIHTREPQPTPVVQLYVHVDGAVASPGVYRLAADSRVFEAIDVAGGAAEEADLAALNLAAKVADGQKLVVPRRGAGPASPGAPAASEAGGEPASTPPAAPAGAGARININSASQRVLESLPGIGPVTAQRIITYRQQNGPFTRIEQLRQAGVNASTYERIKDLVTV